jgi:hypothetical protein
MIKHLRFENKSLWATGTAVAVAALCALSASSFGADEAMTELLQTLRQRGSISETEYERISKTAVKASPLTASSLKDKWYEKMSIRGYVQTRFTHVLGAAPDALDPTDSKRDQSKLQLHSPTEPNITQRDSLLMRRGRMIFSGDVHDHLYLYAQVDWQAGAGSSISTTNQSGLQTRDLYGDVSIDHDKEHRLRIGVSKVPYGWVNLQSSQNRLSIERPEALNSAVEGERDLGLYYIWANKEARQRFRDLVRMGLKGSGDYGVLSAGVYGGQGLNRLDGNRNMHAIVHASYPFQLDNGQYFEIGASAYTGQFAPTAGSILAAGTSTAAAVVSSGTTAITGPTTNKKSSAFSDRRVAANFVWYPQPFGIEAEWTYGQGPETVLDYDANGKGTARFSRIGGSGSLRRFYPVISTEKLHGGYVLANYKIDEGGSTYIPFVRWSYFDGARKFAAGAPTQKVNEVDFGVEYQPWSCFEVTAVYTHAFERSNTSSNYLVKNVDRVTLQLQFNF